MLKPTEDYEVIGKYKGLQYAVYFHDVQGFRCGYVEIPEDHPLYGKYFGDIDFNTIGLTFSGYIKHLNGWFIGWDHHHLWDGIDEEGIRKSHANLPENELEDILNYARSMTDDKYGLVSTTEDVEDECKQVIDEVIRLGQLNND